MKLAFITSLAPTEAPDTGFEIANAAIIAALRAAGHHLTIFAFARPEDRVRADPDLVLIRRMVIENSAAGPARKAMWLAAALLRGIPFAAAKLWLAGRTRLLDEIDARGPFDALVLNGVMMPGAFPDMTSRAPALLIAHNIEHASARQNADHAGNALMRWLFARESRLLEALESGLARDCAAIWCLADEDRQALARLAGPDALARCAVLPLVSGGGRKLEPVAHPRHDVGLIGTWTWEPNLIGLRWFLREVAPRLPADCTIAVAGRIPAGVEPPPNVAMVGRVPDADAFLADCAVVALASRAGTGVQLKTIETLQLGLPAVATSLSFRGLCAPPVNVRIADEPAAFAKALAEHVAAVRSGAITRLDGASFMHAQQAELTRAIAAGLGALERKPPSAA